MDIREMRLECLRLAIGVFDDSEAIVARARAFADFVEQTNDGEVIAAAREFASKVEQAR